MNPDFPERNVAAQREDQGSLFHFYRRLLRLRREEGALRHGELRWLAQGTDGVLAYERSCASGERVGVALNFSDSAKRVRTPWRPGGVVFGTHRGTGERLGPCPGGRLTLAPLEVVIWRMA